MQPPDWAPGVWLGSRAPVQQAALTCLARDWAAAIAGISCIPMEHTELEALLAGFTDRLARHLDQEPDDPRLGEEIGAELVAAHVATPEGIGRTIELLAARLPAAAGCPDQRARVARLFGAVVTGFARAARERTLAEQESIRRADLDAREQAEVALRESEARFRYQATHDPLTNLANRALFTQRLAGLFAQGTGAGTRPRRVGVCFVDLDGFKVVNDTLGHHVGDLLLTAVAERLRQHLASPSRLVARLGGDEFVILIEDTSGAEDAVTVAEIALAAIAEPTWVDGHELTVSASIGIVERELGMTSPSEVMRAADLTLQWAKSTGKGRWAVFDPARNQRELARYARSAAIPGALERGELFLAYQPIVSLGAGAVTGVAALVRWRHPQQGVLGPDQFLAPAEETGLIVRLGRWVLAQACEQARQWERNLPYPPLVSVPLTPRQIRDPRLVESVTCQLGRSGLAPHRLQLEIGEGAVDGTDREPVQNLFRLAELGVRIAVNDFGTGYCHLPSLRTLPVHGLKLAETFVAGVPAVAGTAAADQDSTTTDERVLATLVSLAHTLRLQVTAEGVETAAQAARLRTLGCDLAQGRHFGCPTSPDRLMPQLTGGRR
jgi:diguanylate cyclase (GGDEF)-like protein